jgi:hypothetical protein
VDEIPFQIKVVEVVPLLEHSLVGKSLMEEDLEMFAVVVVVVVAGDRLQAQEKQSMVNV